LAPAAAEINAPQTRVSRKIVHLNTRQPKNLMQPLGYGSRFHRLYWGDLSLSEAIKTSYCLSVCMGQTSELCGKEEKKNSSSGFSCLDCFARAAGRKTTSSG